MLRRNTNLFMEWYGFANKVATFQNKRFHKLLKISNMPQLSKSSKLLESSMFFEFLQTQGMFKICDNSSILQTMLAYVSADYFSHGLFHCQNRAESPT